MNLGFIWRLGSMIKAIIIRGSEAIQKNESGSSEVWGTPIGHGFISASEDLSLHFKIWEEKGKHFHASIFGSNFLCFHWNFLSEFTWIFLTGQSLPSSFYSLTFWNSPEPTQTRGSKCTIKKSAKIPEVMDDMWKKRWVEMKCFISSNNFFNSCIVSDTI